MKTVVVLFSLVCLAVAQQQIRNDNDDGSYDPNVHERPYEYDNALHAARPEDAQGLGYQPQQQRYQPQPQSYQSQAYQPQPQAYRPQPQAYRPQQQAYQPQPQVYEQPQVYQQPQAYQQQPQPQYFQQQPSYQQQAYRQLTDSKHAAILTENRYLEGDGKFGASYTQEDGVEFKEESDPDGTRRGSYSYIDPTGQRKTVSYTAGKNGFQATGAHLPVAPVPGATPHANSANGGQRQLTF